MYDRSSRTSRPTPSTGTTSPTRWLNPLIIITIAAIASWALVNPHGDFPLNDDWAYASSVRHLLFDGHLVLSDWSAPLALVHIFTGFLFAKVFGFSHRKPLDQIGEWEWERPELIHAIISYSPELPFGTHWIKQKIYFSLLSPRGATLYLYGKEKSDWK